MRELIIFILIAMCSGIAISQTLTGALQDRISHDNDVIQHDSQNINDLQGRINALNAEMQYAINDETSYNAIVPAAQTEDQAIAVAAQPAQQVNSFLDTQGTLTPIALESSNAKHWTVNENGVRESIHYDDDNV